VNCDKFISAQQHNSIEFSSNRRKCESSAEVGEDAVGKLDFDSFVLASISIYTFLSRNFDNVQKLLLKLKLLFVSLSFYIFLFFE